MLSNTQKILIVHCYYKIRSGECVIAHNEVKLLQENGFSAELFTLDNNKNVLLTFFSVLIAPFNIFSFFKVYKKVKQFKPDIVHVHNWYFTISPAVFIATRLLKVRTIYSLHNYRLLCPSATLFFKDKLFLNSVNQKFPIQAVIKRVYKNSFLLTFWISFIIRLHHLLGTWKKIDCYTVNSVFAKKLFINSYLKLKPEQIIVKSNFNFFEEGINSTHRGNNYLFAGRLSEEKGIIFLLEAAATMNFNLIIIGEGSLQKKVVEYANKYENITYLGKQPRTLVLEELCKCKAMIFPSLWFEGMPLSIIEALQVGTPVISSNVGVMKEMIQHKVNGLLFNPNDINDFKTALEYFDTLSANERELYNKAAYNSFEKNYTPQQNISQLKKIYFPENN